MNEDDDSGSNWFKSQLWWRAVFLGIYGRSCFGDVLLVVVILWSLIVGPRLQHLRMEALCMVRVASFVGHGQLSVHTSPGFGSPMALVQASKPELREFVPWQSRQPRK